MCNSFTPSCPVRPHRRERLRRQRRVVRVVQVRDDEYLGMRRLDLKQRAAVGQRPQDRPRRVTPPACIPRVSGTESCVSGYSFGVQPGSIVIRVCRGARDAQFLSPWRANMGSRRWPCCYAWWTSVASAIFKRRPSNLTFSSSARRSGSHGQTRRGCVAQTSGLSTPATLGMTSTASSIRSSPSVGATASSTSGSGGRWINTTTNCRI